MYILFTKTSCVNWHDESYASWVFQTCSVVLNDEKITEKKWPALLLTDVATYLVDQAADCTKTANNLLSFLK